MDAGALPDSEPAGERRLALVCHTWGHPGTFYSWVFMKQYLLRRVEQDGVSMLDPREKLYIVKAGKADEGRPDHWKVGGPLLPDLDTALQHYPHTVVKLEGSVKSNIHTFLAQHAIDILVMPDHWPSTVLTNLPGFTTVSEWVKQNVHCPFIITRRDTVVNARMKISSHLPTAAASSVTCASASEVLERTATMTLGRTAAQAGRRIAIAYNSFAAGRGLMQFARDSVLTHNDTVYICHCFSNQSPAGGGRVVKDAIKFMRVMTLQKADSFSDEVTRDNSIQFGAAELAGYNVQLNITLQGDPKSSLSAFCESEEIELLIIGSRSGGKIRKKLSGGGVSSHLIDNAPCPCLVVPYKFMGVDDGATGDDELASSPSSPPLGASHGAGGVAAAAAGWSSSPAGGASPKAGASAAWAGAGAAGGPVDAAVQTEGMAAPPRAAAVADTVAGAGGGGSGGSGHSTPSDLLTSLQRQIEEKDSTIAELRQQVAALRLAAAEREASETHDPMQAGHAM